MGAPLEMHTARRENIKFEQKTLSMIEGAGPEQHPKPSPPIAKKAQLSYHFRIPAKPP